MLRRCCFLEERELRSNAKALSIALDTAYESNFRVPLGCMEMLHFSKPPQRMGKHLNDSYVCICYESATTSKFGPR